MNRAPSTIWPVRQVGVYPNYYVQTEDDDRISIASADGGMYMTAILMSRKDARLLAKRINQCLDETVKK